MERKNKCKKLGFSTILCAVAAIMLCAAPSLQAADETVPPFGPDIDYHIEGSLTVNGTANILTGAVIDCFVYANSTSVVNITGGTVGYWIDVAIGAEVTVFGTYFELNGTQYYAGDELFIRYLYDSPLTVIYDNGTQVDLSIDCHYVTGRDNATVTLAAPGSPILIDIDIKPGSNPNPINPGSNGLIPVAIFTTDEFNATTVIPESVELNGATVPMRGKSGKYMAHEEDVNEDGLTDLVVQVETEGLGEVGDDGIVKLTGETTDGAGIEGYDVVVIVPPEE